MAREYWVYTVFDCDAGVLSEVRLFTDKGKAIDHAVAVADEDGYFDGEYDHADGEEVLRRDLEKSGSYRDCDFVTTITRVERPYTEDA